MKTRLMLCALFAVLALGAAPAWAGKLLVLESDPPTLFKKGRTFDGGREITIPDGGRLVLMDERGLAVTIKGPYTGIPGGGEQGNGPTFLERLGAILSPSGDDSHPVLGATRAMNTTQVPSDPWAIDVTAGGAMCIRAGSAMALWRPLPRPAAVVSLGPPSGSSGARVFWPAEQELLPWPATIQITDGATYGVQFDSPEPRAASFVLHVGPSSLSADYPTLDWLASVGCAAQTRALVSDLGRQKIVDGAAAAGRAVFE